MILQKVAQIIADNIIKKDPINFYLKFKIRCLSMAKSFLLKFSDPLITAKIGNFQIALPFSHNLPAYLKKYPYYSTNLARIAEAVNRHFKDFSLIDIGANVCDSVALLRSKSFFPILCIEGDDYFFSILEKNSKQFNNVSLCKVFLGEKNCADFFSLNAIGGTASIQKNEEGRNFKIQILSNVLDDFKKFKRSKMLKIDTDGFDGFILKGATQFIKEMKPIIFFEFDPFFLKKQNDNGLAVIMHLKKLGYSHALVYDNFGELICGINLEDSLIVESLNNYYTGKNGFSYADICAFHKENQELYKKVYATENQFFLKHKNEKKHD